jgi:general secretion pathway protein I
VDARPTPPGRRDAGFTLVEVLVALVILATAVVAVLQLFGGGLRLARSAGDHTGATVLASAKLGELPAGPLEEGSIEGDAGPYRWTRRVVLAPDLLPPVQGTPDAPRLRLARVSVEVRWGRERRLELTTLRAWLAAP